MILGSSGTGVKEYYGSSGKNYGFLVSDSTAASFNNIYCIEHGGRLSPGRTVSWWSGYSNLYHVRAVITLTGAPEGTGYVKYYGEGGFGYGDSGVNQGEQIKPGMHNRIMSLILNDGIHDRDLIGMWQGDRKWSTLYKITKSFICILGNMA